MSALDRLLRVLVFCLITFFVWLLVSLVIWTHSFDVARAAWNGMALIVLPLIWILFALVERRLFGLALAQGRELFVMAAAVTVAALAYWPLMAIIFLALAAP